VAKSPNSWVGRGKQLLDIRIEGLRDQAFGEGLRPIARISSCQRRSRQALAAIVLPPFPPDSVDGINWVDALVNTELVTTSPDLRALGC
jgi:hypothetical protein